MKTLINVTALASLLPAIALVTNVACALDKANGFPLSSRGSERATSGGGNKIITHKGKTHVAWLDSTEKGYFARVRTLDRKTGRWSPTYTLGKASDNHGRPAMTLDSKGYLHVVYGIHHDTVPYKRSVRPNDASEWTEKKTFGGRMSYPTFVCGPDDTLYLTGRYGWKGVRFYVKPPGKDWEDRGLILRTRKDCFSYAAFHEGLAWGPDHRTLHLSCSFYQSQTQQTNLWGTIQSANYMRSTDFGKTWQRANGTPIELPATSRTMDVLAAGESAYPKPGIRNQGAIVVDSRGRPYVLYSRYNMNPPGQLFLVRPDELGHWQHLPLQGAMDKYYPGWTIAGKRPGFTITEDDVLCIAMKIIPREHAVAEAEKAAWKSGTGYSTNAENVRLSLESAKAWAKENPKKCEVAWLESRDGGKTFTAKAVLKRDPAIAYQQPSLEMPTGFNRIAAGSYPDLIHFTGLVRNAGQNEVIDNDVFYVDVSTSEPLVPTPWSPTPWMFKATLGDGEVLLDWNDTLGSEGYNLYRSEVSGGPYNKRNDSLLADTQFLDATIVGNVKYFYAVTAVYGGTESENSAELMVIYRPPCVPLSLAGALGIDGLHLWLDASDLDADGNTENNPVEGERVGLWRDKICGLNFSQPNSTRRPVMSTLGENAAPAVNFNPDDGADDFLLNSNAGSSSIFGDVEGSVVFVATTRNVLGQPAMPFEAGSNFRPRPDRVLKSFGIILFNGGRNTGGYGSAILQPNSWTSAFVDDTLNPMNDGALHVSIVQPDDTKDENYCYIKDGVESTSSACRGTCPTPADDGRWFSSMTSEVGEFIALGARSFGKGESHSMEYKGQIAEIMIFDHPLDAVERAAVADYIDAKYRE